MGMNLPPVALPSPAEVAAAEGRNNAYFLGTVGLCLLAGWTLDVWKFVLLLLLAAAYWYKTLDRRRAERVAVTSVEKWLGRVGVPTSLSIVGGGLLLGFEVDNEQPGAWEWNLGGVPVSIPLRFKYGGPNWPAVIAGVACLIVLCYTVNRLAEVRSRAAMSPPGSA